MSETKWTPGPWFVCGVRQKLEKHDFHAISRYDEANKKDDQIALVYFVPKTGLGLADARLIAAALELAEALEGLLDLYSGGGMLSENAPELDGARAALQKARGE